MQRVITSPLDCNFRSPPSRTSISHPSSVHVYRTTLPFPCVPIGGTWCMAPTTRKWMSIWSRRRTSPRPNPTGDATVIKDVIGNMGNYKLIQPWILPALSTKSRRCSVFDRKFRSMIWPWSTDPAFYLTSMPLAVPSKKTTSVAIHLIQPANWHGLEEKDQPHRHWPALKKVEIIRAPLSSPLGLL